MNIYTFVKNDFYIFTNLQTGFMQFDEIYHLRVDKSIALLYYIYR